MVVLETPILSLPQAFCSRTCGTWCLRTCGTGKKFARRSPNTESATRFSWRRCRPPPRRRSSATTNPLKPTLPTSTREECFPESSWSSIIIFLRWVFSCVATHKYISGGVSVRLSVKLLLDGQGLDGEQRVVYTDLLRDSQDRSRFRCIYFCRSNLPQDLTELGIWDEDMKNQIISNNGSIQGIERIPKEIRDLYKTVWEIR